VSLGKELNLYGRQVGGEEIYGPLDLEGHAGEVFIFIFYFSFSVTKIYEVLGW
jgi:hypothetical protein